MSTEQSPDILTPGLNTLSNAIEEMHGQPFSAERIHDLSATTSERPEGLQYGFALQLAESTLTPEARLDQAQATKPLSLVMDRQMAEYIVERIVAQGIRLPVTYKQ